MPARIGRIFGPQDDSPNAPPVAVLSYSYRERRFSRDPRAIGKRIVIRNTAQSAVAIEIVGVARRGFFGEKVGAAPLVFLLALTGAVLLIACANLANSLMARAAGRPGQIGWIVLRDRLRWGRLWVSWPLRLANVGWQTCFSD
jgi:hypothetical protein